LLDLFENFEHYLSQIATIDRYNCFFTVSHTDNEKRRKQTHQTAIFFDIDKIELSKKEAYIAPLEKVLKINMKDALLICSGRGLHLLVQTTEHTLKSKSDYEALQPAYKILCSRIDAAL